MAACWPPVEFVPVQKRASVAGVTAPSVADALRVGEAVEGSVWILQQGLLPSQHQSAAFGQVDVETAPEGYSVETVADKGWADLKRAAGSDFDEGSADLEFAGEDSADAGFVDPCSDYAWIVEVCPAGQAVVADANEVSFSSVAAGTADAASERETVLSAAATAASWLESVQTVVTGQDLYQECVALEEIDDAQVTPGVDLTAHDAVGVVTDSVGVGNFAAASQLAVAVVFGQRQTYSCFAAAAAASAVYKYQDSAVQVA